MDFMTFYSRLFLNFTTQIVFISLAFMLRYEFRKERIWALVLTDLVLISGPIITKTFFNVSFYSAPFLMIGWYSVSYLIICSLLTAVYRFSIKVPTKNVVLIISTAYLLQNMLYYLSNILTFLFPILKGKANAILTSLLFVSIVVLLSILTKKGKIKINSAFVKTPITFAITIIVFVLLTVVSQWLTSSKNDPTSLYAVSMLYALIAAIISFALLTSVFSNSRLKNDNIIINELLKKSENQQRVTQQNIEYINFKVHDLKHQLSAIKKLIKEDENNPQIKDGIVALENTSKFYEDMIVTGNNMLDSLLNERKLYCDNNNIHLECMVDGKSLEFMNPVDLYVIFGNALDNACEYGLKIGDEDKRIISIVVSRRGKLVNILFENYCTDDISIVDGLPKTSKEDKESHGFGIKSIKFLASKYGGNCSVFVEKHHFCVSIIVPVLETNSKNLETS